MDPKTRVKVISLHLFIKLDHLLAGPINSIFSIFSSLKTTLQQIYVMLRAIVKRNDQEADLLLKVDNVTFTFLLSCKRQAFFACHFTIHYSQIHINVHTTTCKCWFHYYLNVDDMMTRNITLSYCDVGIQH